MECLAPLFSLGDGREVIVLTKLADNPGPSVTKYAATTPPTAFADLASVPPEKVRFIEHSRPGLPYPPYAGDDWETWDELQFDTTGGATIFRCWMRLDRRGSSTA